MNPFDFVSAVSYTKEDIMPDTLAEKAYNPYLTNKSLSYHQDAVLFANEMNSRYHLDHRLQFQFLINTLRQRKRFSKWEKSEKLKDLDIVKEYYGCSSKRAEEYLSLLDDNSILNLKQTMNKGGINHGRTTE